MPKIILASKSKVRKKILDENDILNEVKPSNVDEDIVKLSLSKEKATPEIISKNLAELKANKVSNKYVDDLVLGADSVIDLEGELISKPNDRNEALGILKKLNGKKHHLISSVCISKNGAMVWNHTDSSELKMKNFTDEQLLNYLNKIRSMGGEFFEDIFDLEIDEVSIGWRPIPIDGKPIIGRLDHNPNIYLATMHSGISLGPLVGSLVARELVQDIEIPVLENFRPSRFD